MAQKFAFTCATIAFIAFFAFTEYYELSYADEYRIGIGDVIQISVWQYEQFNTTVPVGPDGKITIHLLGDIVADGYTRDELKEEISKRLSKFIKEGAEVTVSVTQFNSQKVSVFGSVMNPRTITFSSIPSMLEVIMQAVPAPNADLTSVKIIPADTSIRNPILVNVSDVLQTGDTSKLPVLSSGDTIYVPKAEVSVSAPETVTQIGTTPTTQTQQATASGIQDERFVVNVMGAVANPNSYVFEKEPTLAQVLIKAGSVADNTSLKDVRVIRNMPTDSERVIHVDMSKYLIDGDNSILPRIYSGDIVYVPPLTQEKMRELSITITGEVAKPGVYMLSNPVDILDAIYMAGGLTPNADTERIRLRKEDADSYQDKIVNISDFLKDVASRSQTEMIKPGYTIYVPMKQRGAATTTALASRSVVALLADLIPIYSLYRLIR